MRKPLTAEFFEKELADYKKKYPEPRSAAVRKNIKLMEKVIAGKRSEEMQLARRKKNR